MIKRSAFLSVYLFITKLGLFASLSVAETKQSCTEKFNTWLERYTSSNVFVALNKNQEPLFSADELMSIKLHLEEIELINRQIKELEKEYLKIKDNERFEKNFQIIQSILGVGPLFAASLAVEIGDWKRFNNEKQVAAFFGLTPAEFSPW